MMHPSDNASSKSSASSRSSATLDERAAFLSAHIASPAIAIWAGDADDVDEPLTNDDSPTTKQRRRSVCRELCDGLPWVVLMLSAVQCIAYLTLPDSAVQRLMLPAEPLQYLMTTEWWRYLSYSMVHMSFVHLGINVAVLLLVGTALETEQGHVRVMLVYAVGVVGGALATARCQPRLRLHLAGSSAGVSAVLMSHVPHTALNFHQLPYRFFRPVAILILCANDAVDLVRLWTAAAAAQTDAHLPSSTTMSVSAHIGGAVAGLLAGAVFFTTHVTDAGAMFAVTLTRLVGCGVAVLLVIKCVP